jgi:hypothetical protein
MSLKEMLHFQACNLIAGVTAGLVAWQLPIARGFLGTTIWCFSLIALYLATARRVS